MPNLFIWSKFRKIMWLLKSMSFISEFTVEQSVVTWKRERFVAYSLPKSQIPLRYLVADRFEAGSKLVADLQRAEVWPVI